MNLPEIKHGYVLFIYTRTNEETIECYKDLLNNHGKNKIHNDYIDNKIIYVDSSTDFLATVDRVDYENHKFASSRNDHWLHINYDEIRVVNYNIESIIKNLEKLENKLK